MCKVDFFNKGYSYGFNGQEKDDEIKGTGNSLNYKHRMADVRLGRFFAVDPIASEYPELTTYQMSSLNPIWKIEIEGLEGRKFQDANGISNVSESTNCNQTNISLNQEIQSSTQNQSQQVTFMSQDKSTSYTAASSEVHAIKNIEFNIYASVVTSGPFASLGYMIDKEAGANIGAAVDNSMAAASCFGGASARPKIVPSTSTVNPPKLTPPPVGTGPGIKIVKPAKVGSGTRYIDPKTKSEIRVMNGKPNAKFDSQKLPYVVNNLNGDRMTNNGTIGIKNSEATHIPAHNFIPPPLYLQAFTK
jgi:RHS repeat-associated protein